jgi:peptidoglycan-associated lipoprotein
MYRTTAVLLASLAFTLSGCHKPKVADPTDDGAGRPKRANVSVSDDIMKACKIQVENVARAPKFDYDDAELLPEDRDILEQIAKCVTTGPLKGRHLALVGRADPRGEVEYNMVLGDYRAESVHDYLAKLGVSPDAMAKTSRGELDAEGKDEDGWRRDRRVDISLQSAQMEKATRTAERSAEHTDKAKSASH